MDHGGKHIHLGVSLCVSQNWTVVSGVDWSDTSAARAFLLREFSDWSVDLKRLILNCDDGIVLRLIYALPVGYSWVHAKGMTLLGDAAHVMSPYAGEGAYLDMLDAIDLALLIVEHGDNIEVAVKEYEAAMFLRSRALSREIRSRPRNVFRRGLSTRSGPLLQKL